MIMNEKDKKLVASILYDLEKVNSEYSKISGRVFFDKFQLFEFENYDKSIAGKIGIILRDIKYYRRPKVIKIELVCINNGVKSELCFSYNVSRVKEPIIEPKIINLMPEPIKIITDKGSVTFTPSGRVTRLKNKFMSFNNIIHLANGIEISDSVVSNNTTVLGLPDEDRDENIIYIVPRAIVELYYLRQDLRFPAKEIIKDNKIIGYRCLADIER